MILLQICKCVAVAEAVQPYLARAISVFKLRALDEIEVSHRVHGNSAQSKIAEAG